jgi:hypothetical protein
MKKKITIIIIIVGAVIAFFFAPMINFIFIDPFFDGYRNADEELQFQTEGQLSPQNEICEYLAFTNQTILMVHWYPRIRFGPRTPETDRFQKIWRSGFSLRCKKDGYKLEISEYNTPFPPPEPEPFIMRNVEEWIKENAANN